MIKYVVHVGRTAHAKVLFKDLEKNSEVMLEKEFRSSFMRKINILHTSCKTNYFFRIPFQKIWYKKYLDLEKLGREDRILFLLCEENRLCYDSRYINFLRRKFVNAKVVFYAINSSDTIGKKYVAFVNDNYDYAVTFDKEDSAKYGWIYYSGVYSMIERKDCQIKYDVFFAGNNAGRLEQLHSIYKYLSERGIKCCFYINGVPENEMLKDSDIIYNKKLSYDEIMNADQETNCILEVLRENQKGTTLRMAESILLGKKIITNNRNVRDERYFDESRMLIFANVEDICVEFCKEKDREVSPYDGCLAPERMLNYIYETVFESIEE